MDFVDLGNYDFLATSSTLRRHGMKREFFDPMNLAHIESMKHYMRTGNWLTQFLPEAPYIDVPMTVFRKFAGFYLGVDVTETQKEAKRPQFVLSAVKSEPAIQERA